MSTRSLNRSSLTGFVALLLFASGFSALVYETVWFRMFRLVFGASTAANSAVLATFMAGLGAGAYFLGRRGDLVARPLRFYGLLEIVASVIAALTPWLASMVNWLYISLGGTPNLGSLGGTIVRLVLTALVLGVPAMAMGASLPAATRAVESASDEGRRRLAILYGFNTTGAVAGVLLATFVLLERFGNQRTLWLAVVVNLAAGVGALLLDRVPVAATANDVGEPSSGVIAASGVSRPFVLFAAAMTGVVFFVLELVWYRMLTPILGGTTFTFGLILGVALAGIGGGGLLRALVSARRQATVHGFALTCAVEAVFIGIPFALGDSLALLTLQLRPLGVLGFDGLLIGWLLITFVVVLPPALVAGYQFPLLISILGSGETDVASDVGVAYAFNTAGAIVGSLAGGFGLLPLLSAPGTWRMTAILMAVVAVVAAVETVRLGSTPWRIALPVVISVLAVWLVTGPEGPTAFWRHSPIGAGRVVLAEESRTELRNYEALQRRTVVWDADGVESSVALSADHALAFVINGKIDGNARFDAGTQVMGGITGALLHPDPTRALVIGLGTGSSAGWLGAVPGIERVDVVELEPLILKVAEACKAVNRDVLNNDRVTVHIGDAREYLRVTRDHYDIVFSEPSNPYRAGIASLFTVEFYRAAEEHLTEEGIFLQWVQAYEIDAETLRTIYASLTKVFPVVETWQTQTNDLLLVARRSAKPYNVSRMRGRLATSPYAEAVEVSWLVDDAEGVFAHFLAGNETSKLLAAGVVPNTDDRTIIEYSFARSLGEETGVSFGQVLGLARYRGDSRPPVDEELDWRRLEYARMSMTTSTGSNPYVDPTMDEALLSRASAHESYVVGNLNATLGAWSTQGDGPSDFVEIVSVADAAADVGDARAIALIDAFQERHPREAGIVTARFLRRKGRTRDAAEALARAWESTRNDPWVFPMVMDRSFSLALEISRSDGDSGRRLLDALAEPFSVRLFEERRLATRFSIAAILDEGGECSAASMPTIEAFEPYVPWNRDFLGRRAACYRRYRHPRADEAKEDLETFLRQSPASLSAALSPQ